MFCCEASAGGFLIYLFFSPFRRLILFERLRKRSMKYGVWNCSRHSGGRPCGFLPSWSAASLSAGGKAPASACSFYPKYCLWTLGPDRMCSMARFPGREYVSGALGPRQIVGRESRIHAGASVNLILESSLLATANGLLFKFTPKFGPFFDAHARSTLFTCRRRRTTLQ